MRAKDWQLRAEAYAYLLHCLITDGQDVGEQFADYALDDGFIDEDGEWKELEE